jgi:hypothetical protein
VHEDPAGWGAERLTVLLTRRCGAAETARDVGNGYCFDSLVSETRGDVGDVGDARRRAHNPATNSTAPRGCRQIPMSRSLHSKTLPSAPGNNTTGHRLRRRYGSSVPRPRGPVRGPGRRIIPAPRVPPVR